MDMNCSDDGCGAPDSWYPVGTKVDLLVEDDDLVSGKIVSGKIIFHPSPTVKDCNNYLVLTEEGGIYIVDIDDIDEYISGNNGDENDDGTPQFGIGTKIERDWGERGYAPCFARIAAIPCTGGCGGMCEENPSGAKCGGRDCYEAEYFDNDSFRELISPAAIGEFVVGESQGSYRMPPCPATLDVVALSLLAAGLSVDDPPRDGSGSDGGVNIPSLAYSATTIASIEDALANATIMRVDPTAIEGCFVGTCDCGATAQTKLRVKNKGPGQHPDTTCWECARASNHPISDWVQNSAACLCCADRFDNFQNCKECVESLRFCKSCEKLGCDGANRYCRDCIRSGARGADKECKSCGKLGCHGISRYCKECIDSGARGAGQKCKNYAECGNIGTYRESLNCRQCEAARNLARQGTSEVCVRCLTPKTSPEYVAVPGSSGCADCKGLCKAWTAKGKLCNEPGAKNGVRQRHPLCNEHKGQCITVGKKHNKKYIVDGPGNRTGWPRCITRTV